LNIKRSNVLEHHEVAFKYSSGTLCR